MFAAGFVLGFFAELLEMPVMLVVMAIMPALVAREKRWPTISTPAGPGS